jgi:hypothetical protein
MKRLPPRVADTLIALIVTGPILLLGLVVLIYR